MFENGAVRIIIEIKRDREREREGRREKVT
jgi:hypothetical protein